jgi:hypothetical protein
MNYQPQIKDEINKFLELRRRLTELYPDLEHFSS